MRAESVFLGLAVVGGCALIGYGGYKLFVKPAIELKEGGNYVTYVGPVVRAETALVTILDYIVLIYYYDEETEAWYPVSLATLMRPGKHYEISVSQDCRIENFQWWEEI